MRSTLASCRQRHAAPIITIEAGSETTQSFTGTLYLQAQTGQGVNLPSPGTPFVLASGQRLRITLPSDARRPAEDIRNWLISYSPENSALTSVVIASLPGYNILTYEETPLPAEILLYRDEHFKISAHVATPDNLPSGEDVVLGMRRYVDSINVLVSFEEIVVAQAITYSWVKAVPNSFSTYLVNTKDADTKGCDRDIRVVPTEDFLIYDYDVSGALSTPVKFWIVNDTVGSFQKGTRIGITFSIDGQEFFGTEKPSSYSVLIANAGAAKIRFLGYANLNNQQIDTTNADGTTTMEGVNSWIDYVAEPSNLVLQKDLPPNHAWMGELQLECTVLSLDGQVSESAVIGFYPQFYTNRSKFIPAGYLFGDLIAPYGGYGRVVPTPGLNAKVLERTGIVNSYEFYGVGANFLIGLIQNTAEQLVSINGNGSCFVVGEVPAYARLRAIVSTENGTGAPTAWSPFAVQLDSSTLLKVSVNFPTFVREDYPDVIALSPDGQFNAARLAFYIMPYGGGQIQKFEATVLTAVSQQFLLGASPGENIGATLPAFDDNSFGLYQIANDGFTVDTAVGTSVFAAGEYVVAIACVYENTVTRISHDPALGCVPELPLTFAEALENMAYWGKPQQINLLLAMPSKFIRPYFQCKAIANGSWQNVVYDPRSFAFADNQMVYRPNDLTASKPGRWIVTDPDQNINRYYLPALTIDQLLALFVGEDVPNGAQREILRNGQFEPFQWRIDSLKAHNGASVIRPPNIPEDQPGRWEQKQSGDAGLALLFAAAFSGENT